MANAVVEIRRLVVPDDHPDPSYLEQEGWEDRLASYRRGDFHFLGVRAHARISIPYGQDFIQTEVCSPGLWGIESDSDEAYFDEVYEEERRTLIDMFDSLHDYVIKGQTVDLSALLNEHVSVLGVDHE